MQVCASKYSALYFLPARWWRRWLTGRTWCRSDQLSSLCLLCTSKHHHGDNQTHIWRSVMYRAYNQWRCERPPVQEWRNESLKGWILAHCLVYTACCLLFYKSSMWSKIVRSVETSLNNIILKFNNIILNLSLTFWKYILLFCNF